MESQKDAALSLVDVVDPDDPRLDDFYALYGSVFTLPEEREPIEGFRTVLHLTAGAAVQTEFGPIREQITLAIDPETNAVVGATNYVFYGYDQRWSGEGIAASSQLNFICVDKSWRSRRIATRLLRDLEEKLRQFALEEVPQSRGGLFITCEQNNPDAMTQEQLAADLEASGTDAHSRLKWWRDRDYKKLDFRYVQPPLNPGQEACTYLDYYVHFVGSDTRATLPARILREHLRRFFFVSVGKLEIDMESNPQWIAQRDALSRRDVVAISA